jgi:hypothetical protein
MILDQRIYDLFPGKVPDYMAAVRELALPIRRKYGVLLASWYYTEVGKLNRVYHTWAYRDWQHFAEAKEQVRKDPDWVQKYVPRVLPLIQRQRNQIVLAADFSPVPQF